MKKLIYCLLICTLAATACKKEEVLKGPQDDEVSLDLFVSALSKAVYNSEELRVLLKTEALKTFDKDYDVFYPFVKDYKMSSGKTLKEILLQYEDEETLNRIESKYPLLNVFIPDWEWIGGFSCKTWDTSKEFVTVCSGGEKQTHTLFLNGGPVLQLNDDEIPSCPVLVVKENERLQVNMTKSSSPSYSFKNPAYDNTGRTKAREWKERDFIFPVEGWNHFVPLSEIDNLLVEAYQEFNNGTNPDACQRDYVYYGMSTNNTDHGEYKPYIRERLYRFRINAASYNTISDQNEDPHLHETLTIKGSKNAPSTQELYDMIWTRGSLAFQFDVIFGEEGESIEHSANQFIITTFADQVYDLSKIHEKYKQQNLFAQGLYIYTFNPEDLVPKWVYPEEPLYFSKWDIEKQSAQIKIVVTEIDESETIEDTIETSFEYAHNFGWNIDVGNVMPSDSIKVKLGFGLKGGNTTTTTNKETIKITTKKDSDRIGVPTLDYIMGVLENPTTMEINGSIVAGYNVNDISSGSVSITILPTDIR